LSLDAFVICGGAELAYLIQNQQGGQTFSLMEYTNIHKGFGVFSSSSQEMKRGFKINDQSLDSLAYGRYTKQLNFTDRFGSRIK